jgi:hypothetical protein
VTPNQQLRKLQLAVDHIAAVIDYARRCSCVSSLVRPRTGPSSPSLTCWAASHPQNPREKDERRP